MDFNFLKTFLRLKYTKKYNASFYFLSCVQIISTKPIRDIVFTLREK